MLNTLLLSSSTWLIRSVVALSLTLRAHNNNEVWQSGVFCILLFCQYIWLSSVPCLEDMRYQIEFVGGPLDPCFWLGPCLDMGQTHPPPFWQCKNFWKRPKEPGSAACYDTCLMRAVASPSLMFPPTWQNGYIGLQLDIVIQIFGVLPILRCSNICSPFQSEISALKQWYFHRHHSQRV